MNSVAAVVVTYNRKELLHECIRALLNSKEACDVIIIDNNSTDGTKKYINDLLSKNDNIKYYKLKENVGGAGGFANGMNIAVMLGYEYVWIMDDDTIVNDDSLGELLTKAKIVDYNFGFLSSTVNWIDGNPCKMNIQTEKKSFDNNIELENNGLKPVTAATFVSLLFKSSVVIEEGLPIKEYFIWGDDKEYTTRISNKYNCYNVIDSVVTHKMKSNEGSNIKTDSIERIDRYFYAYRNDFVTAKRSGFFSILIYIMGFVLNTFRVLFSLGEKKTKRLKVMFKGFFAGIVFNPPIRYIGNDKMPK